jgi:hypothetical protein
MTFSAYIPTWRGSLAVIAAFVDAMIVPLLIPAYDGPGASILDGCIVILLATVTIVVCFHSLHRTRLPDKFAAIVSAAFSFWIFYGFVRRAA